MNTPDNSEFDDIINTQNWGPYGPPANQPVQAVKPGLTKRGKVALAIGVTVIAGGSMLAWQDYSAEADSNQIRAQELTLQQQQLEVEKLKELNKAATRNAKTRATEDAENQKLIEACVDTDKGLVGKQLGVTYSSVVADCQSQYATSTTTGSDIQTAASASEASDGGGGISPTMLLGIGVGGALLVGIAANRGKKANAA
ncbi:hypothetical protein [Streptomyces europaeiscabiei]|uniref:hypothetical protein n=1 Tax=Streptomyces europaeiscabiei TaxID=146819 RepID=UPI002E25EA7C|nr:hypothetical protein OG858_47945 [Streptomyces europaeiscabiei]